MYIYPPSSNEIYHYGTKRRSGRYPYGSGERPFQGLSNRNKILKYYKNGSLTEKALNKLEKINYKNQDDKRNDTQFKKGTEFNRIGSENEIDQGRTYVSVTEKDKQKYIDVSETLYGNNLLTLVSKKNIKVAGLDSQTDSFIKMIKTIPIDKLLQSPVYDYNGKETRGSKIDRSKELQAYIDIFKEGDISKARDEFFKRIAINDEVSQRFFNDLLEKGYDSIIDMNDARFADLPLIILDRNKSVKTVLNRPITTKDKDNAIHFLDKLGL